jgi:hypothetical protein
MNSSFSNPNLAYNNSGYASDEDTLVYASDKKVKQGNFDNGYQENVVVF